jgi:hypothetical protein
MGLLGALVVLGGLVTGIIGPASEAVASPSRPVPRLIAAQPPMKRVRPSAPAAAKAAAGLVPVTKRPKPKPVEPADPYAGIPWSSALCSWYWEPQALAGGGYLTPDAMIVAHKTLPFGTRVQFSYRGRVCIAVVMDRGPYVGSRAFDLGPGTAHALGFDGVDSVFYRIQP